MKNIFIYVVILAIVACSTDKIFETNADENTKKNINIDNSHNKKIYEIGRVQILDLSCIGSNQSLNNKEVILFNFDLDSDGKVKKNELVKSEVISKANQNCIEVLKRSSIDHDFKNFYKIKSLNTLGVVNHFIVGDKEIFLNGPKGIISLDINNDKKPDYIDMCYSSEGLHFNIWDSPQKTNKLFHDYVYLNFETIDNCGEKDYEEK
ncbi:hypothetical protein [Acinetobacter sp. YH12219]|uniref:hypothetical protein n=1 Tax=Acinetobacter sp. YH12219 TaxID=2601153 RepID=UPI0015D27143|nr:hypothetical protein [Acinetobacter sp. YH12219]